MKYREAFCLLTYQDEVTGEKEVIWNSRDGGVPGAIVSRNGNGAFALDDKVFAPAHVPEVGDRIFVGLSEVRARMLAAERIDRFEANHARLVSLGMPTVQDLFETRELAVQSAFEDIYDPQQTDILVVTAGFIEELQELRRGRGAPVLDALEPTEPAVRYFDRNCQAIDQARWIQLSENDDYKRVARTEVNENVFVSTVWLGLDHSFSQYGKPVIFETMVFRRLSTPKISIGGREREFEGDESDRYSTEAEAVAGHARMVALVTAAEAASAALKQN